MTRAETARQAWMRAFESALLTTRPEMAGRIDWNAAIYLHAVGMSAERAAAKVAESAVTP